jgi:hypothetical protein
MKYWNHHHHIQIFLRKGTLVNLGILVMLVNLGILVMLVNLGILVSLGIF